MDKNVYLEMFEVETTHWWFRGRRKILDRLIRAKVYASKPLRISEIGCGTGGNLKMLSQFGQLSAYEYDSVARELACSGTVCEVESCSLPDDPPKIKHQELLCLFDVLEHVENDEAALMALKDLLAPAGRVLLTVPAFSFLWSGHDVAHHHFRRYSYVDLRRKLHNAGYEIEYWSYFNFFLFPLVFLVRCFGVFSSNEKSDAKQPSRWINSFLYKIFGLESLFIPKISLPFGVSLIILARPLDK